MNCEFSTLTILNLMKSKFVDTLRLRYPIIMLIFIGILSAFSWVGSIYGLPVRNLLSFDGLRWCIMNMNANFRASYSDSIILLLLGVGICQESGILMYFRTLTKIRTHRLSLRQRRAFQFTLLFLFLLLALFVYIVLVPESPILSVAGGFEKSPLQFNLFPLVLLNLYILSLVYGLMSGRFQSAADVVTSSTQLLSRMAPCFFSLLLAAQFQCFLRYVCPQLEALPFFIPSFVAILYGIPIVLDFIHAFQR